MKRDKDASSENPQTHKETSKKKTQEDFILRNVALFSAGEDFICVMTDDRLGLGPTFMYSPPILKDHPWTLLETQEHRITDCLAKKRNLYYSTTKDGIQFKREIEFISPM